VLPRSHIQRFASEAGPFASVAFSPVASRNYSSVTKEKTMNDYDEIAALIAKSDA
jgi:hypothetical protein